MPGISPQQQNELPSTYLVSDRRHGQQELKRLLLQDQMVTTSMGGVLPEQSGPTRFHQVLDVGCGTGGWLIEAAKVYPSMSRLVGIDISNRMIEYANAQAREQQVDDRVEFAVMDALRQLAFPDATFDLVNLRFGSSYIRTWEWPQVISELLRLCRPGGIVRLTEPTIIQQSSSPALLQFCDLLQRSLFHSGHFFEDTLDGVTAHLASMLSRYGARSVQTNESALVYRAGTEEGRAFVEDIAYALQTLHPFLERWERVPRDDYHTLCRQALIEMKQPDFEAIWHLFTVWGSP
jgi:ubiquinone/menaquinone biosynthesis C-methylase UbiE